MSYKKLKTHIDRLVDIEFFIANTQHSRFASDHEGYAVLLEEIEEAGVEYDQIVKFDVKKLWHSVKHDMPEGAAHAAADIKKAAIRLACEAVQVAAMAEKYTKSQIARHEADKNGKR